VSLEFVDQLALVFKELKARGTVKIDDPQFQRLKRSEIREVFRKLDNYEPRALAEPVEQDGCQMTDFGRQTSVAEFMFHWLKSTYDKSKRASGARARWVIATWLCASLTLGAFVFASVISLMATIIATVTVLPMIANGTLQTILQPRPFPAQVSELIAYAFIIGLFLTFVFDRYGSKYSVPNEEWLAVNLLDAYSAYKAFIATNGEDRASLAKARSRVKRVVQKLRLRSRGATPWESIRLERQRLSQIGEQIRVRIIRKMEDEKSADEIAEDLVRLARYFLEESSEGIRNAWEMFPSLGTAVPFVPSTWSRVKKIAGMQVHYFMAAVLVMVVFAITYTITRNFTIAAASSSVFVVIMQVAESIRKSGLR
jgi:hypothetical protein